MTLHPNGPSPVRHLVPAKPFHPNSILLVRPRHHGCTPLVRLRRPGCTLRVRLSHPGCTGHVRLYHPGFTPLARLHRPGFTPLVRPRRLGCIRIVKRTRRLGSHPGRKFRPIGMLAGWVLPSMSRLVKLHLHNATVVNAIYQLTLVRMFRPQARRTISGIR